MKHLFLIAVVLGLSFSCKKDCTTHGTAYAYSIHGPEEGVINQPQHFFVKYTMDRGDYVTHFEESRAGDTIKIKPVTIDHSCDQTANLQTDLLEHVFTFDTSGTYFIRFQSFKSANISQKDGYSLDTLVIH